MSTQTRPSTDLAAQVTALQAKVAEARRARARADHEVDAATAAADTARAALQTEFGVTTAEQARELLATLEGDVTAALAALATALATMEQR